MVLFASISIGQTNLGEVVGEVMDVNNDEPLIDAQAFIESDGKLYRALTDLDGRFRISAIPAGVYDLKIKYKTDTITVAGVDVPMNGFFNCGIIDFNKVMVLPDMVVKAGIRMIDGNLPVKTITAKEIAQSPVKFDVNALVVSMSSEVQQADDGQLMFRGARKGDMIYMVDGVKARDLGSVPSVSIGKMQVYTGGLPAKYGDTLGGVVVIESKSYFDLYRAWLATQK